jgi:glutathione S-transferase
MLTLYQTGRAWDAANISPFCTKLETYLRIADIPYEIAPDDLPLWKAPRGKVPYVLFEGQLIDDSSRIIAHLEARLGDTVDGQLGPSDRAVGQLVQRTLEEGTYWCIMYERWLVEDNWQKHTREYFTERFGPPLRWVVPDLIRRRVLGALYGQGTSRRDRERNDLSAIAIVLADKPYLFGERPSSYDAVLYAFSSAIWKTPFASYFGPPPANIAAHLERMHRRYFPELK